MMTITEEVRVKLETADLPLVGGNHGEPLNPDVMLVESLSIILVVVVTIMALVGGLFKYFGFL